MSLNAEVVSTTNQVLDIDSGASKLQHVHRSDKNYNELSTVMINKSLHFPSKSIEWSIPSGSDPDGGRHPLSLGGKTIIWQDFCRKLHENERNWTQRDGARH